MADDDKNKMTAEQVAAGLAWLDAHWAKQDCPICGSNKWSLGEYFVTPIVLSPEGGVIVGGPAYPHMIVTSVDCGYAMFFNAIIAGVFPKPGGNANG